MGVPLDIFNEDDVAKTFGVQPGTLRSWRSQGMPHCKCGRTILYRGKDLRDWLAKHAVNSAE